MLGLWQRVKHMMQAQHLSHYAVETALGLASSQLSSWITNDRYPRADIALKLADYFHVSLQWLLTGDDPYALSPDIVRMVKNKELMATMERVELCNMRQHNAIKAILDAFDL
jgi:transcriptional regulator with XRE-family HTH domain